MKNDEDIKMIEITDLTEARKEVMSSIVVSKNIMHVWILQIALNKD